MSMTYLEYKTAIWEVLGVTSDDGYLPDSVADNLFLASVRYISSLRDWPWLVKTTTYTATVGSEILGTMPVDASKVVYLVGQGNVRNPVRYVSPLALMTKLPENASSSPSVFTTVGSSIRVYPLPATADNFELAYIGSENTSLADSDTFLIPDVYSGLYIYRVAQLAAARNKDSEMYGLMRAQFESNLESAERAAQPPVSVVVPGLRLYDH